MRGYFITIEGGEGSGKTAQINHIKTFVETLGFEVVVTREPGGVPISEGIRSLLLNTEVKEMDAVTEMLLYAAARREHIKSVVLPALNERKVVVCDRYFDSSIVYQGLVKGIPWEYVYNLNLEVTNQLIPDLTIYLDVEPEIGLNRIHSNTMREKNRFDLETIDFHQKVREGYQMLCSIFPRIHKINANQSIENVFQNISTLVKGNLNEWKNEIY